MKNTIKISALVAAMLVSGVASASTSVCTGSTSGITATVSSSTSFIKQAFDAKCSANVFLEYEHNDTQLGVCSVSRKGNFKFAGNTAGGAVAATGSKAANGYSQAQAATVDGCQ